MTHENISSHDSSEIDRAALNEELHDPDTSPERLEEIVTLLEGEGSEAVGDGNADVNLLLALRTMTNQQLSDRLAEPNVSSREKDTIARLVNTGQHLEALDSTEDTPGSSE